MEFKRQWVIDQIKPLLPQTWQLMPYSDSLDTLSRPVVMLQLQTINRTPEAPQGSRTVTYTMTVIEPQTDPKKAEDALDDNLLELIDALDSVPGITWANARRVLLATSNQAFDIDIEVQTVKD